MVFKRLPVSCSAWPWVVRLVCSADGLRGLEGGSLALSQGLCQGPYPSLCLGGRSRPASGVAPGWLADCVPVSGVDLGWEVVLSRRPWVCLVAWQPLTWGNSLCLLESHLLIWLVDDNASPWKCCMNETGYVAMIISH